MSLDSQSSLTPYESSSFATPEGEVLAALYNELLKLAQGETESRLPPPGEVVRSTNRGAFPSGAARFACFYARRSVLGFSISRSEIIYLSPKAIPPPLNLLNQPASGGPNPLNPEPPNGGSFLVVI